MLTNVGAELGRDGGRALVLKIERRVHIDDNCADCHKEWQLLINSRQQATSLVSL